MWNPSVFSTNDTSFSDKVKTSDCRGWGGEGAQRGEQKGEEVCSQCFTRGYSCWRLSAQPFLLHPLLLLLRRRVQVDTEAVLRHRPQKLQLRRFKCQPSGFSPVLPFYVKARPLRRKQRLSHLNESDTRLFERMSAKKKKNAELINYAWSAHMHVHFGMQMSTGRTGDSFGVFVFFASGGMWWWCFRVSKRRDQEANGEREKLILNNNFFYFDWQSRFSLAP